MAYDTQLGAPNGSYDPEGRFTLGRLFKVNASVAAPVTPANIYGLQGMTCGAMSFGATREIFQMGGGDERVEVTRQQKNEGTMTFLSGYVTDFLKAAMNKTFSVAGGSAVAALPIHFANHPIGTMEFVVRDTDNDTHLYSIVVQDIILKEFDWNIALENGPVSIGFYTYHDPFILVGGGSAVGAEMVMDKFNGDGSTVEFTCSSTAIELVDVTDLERDDWVVDFLVYNKVKLSTDEAGVRQVSGFTFGTNKVTFTTAPAASSVVELLYAKAHTA